MCSYIILIQAHVKKQHLSVRLLRRPDTRVPAPLLSSTITGFVTQSNLGKLTDLRTGTGTSSTPSSWRSPAQTNPTTTTSGQRNLSWVQAAKPNPGATTPARSSNQVHSTNAAPHRLVPESASAGGSRASTPAPALPASLDVVPPSPGVVPDDWEDDA